MYWQDDEVTNAAYYNRFKTGVDVAWSILVSLLTILSSGIGNLKRYSTDYELLLDTVKEAKVKEGVIQAFLAYLFFINSNNKKHSQLKKAVADNHAKGNAEAYPSNCHASLTLMNAFKPSVIKGAAPVAAHGTAFAQKQSKTYLGHWQLSATITRNTSLIRSATIAVRNGILQDVVPTRKARQKRTLKITSLS